MNRFKDAMWLKYSKMGYPIIYSIIVLYCCYITIKPIKEEMGWLACIIIYIACYASTQTIKENIAGIKRIVKTKIQWLLLILLFLYTVFSLLGVVYIEPDELGIYLDSSGLMSLAFHKVFYWSFAIMWMLPVFFACMNILYKLFEYQKLKNGDSDWNWNWKWKVGAVLLLMINYSIWIVAFNPCISSPDSQYLFEQAHLMGERWMGDWQPPFYALMLHFLIEIYDSASFIIYVQCLFFSLVFVGLLLVLANRGVSKKVIIIAYIAIGFSFNNVIQMITLWKDIPYMISILWLTAVLARLVWNETSIRWHAELLVSLVFTALFRQNGIMPALAVIICLLLYCGVKKTYKCAVTVVLALTIIFIIKGPVYDYYKVYDEPGLKYFAMANDVLGVYYAGREMPEEAWQMVMEITENNPEEWEFNSYYTNYNRVSLRNYSVFDFLKIYGKTFLKHPRTMLKEVLKRNSVIWSIVKPGREIASCVNYLGECHTGEVEHA